MKEFEIWIEGYAATGERGYAQLIGKGHGETFDEAVKDYMAKTPKHGIEERRKLKGEEFFREDHKPRSNWSIWGCLLFDNEIDARKSFG